MKRVSEGDELQEESLDAKSSLDVESSPAKNLIGDLAEKWRLDEYNEAIDPSTKEAVLRSELGAGVKSRSANGYIGGWKKSLSESALNDDVEGMKRKAANLVQLKVTELALESEDERIALDASKFILGQSGHGVVQKVEHSMQYDGMPTDQLAAMLNSSLARIGKHKPDFVKQLTSRLHALPILNSAISHQDEGCETIDLDVSQEVQQSEKD